MRIPVIVAVALLLWLSGCGGSGNDPGPGPGSSAGTARSSSTAAPTTDTVPTTVPAKQLAPGRAPLRHAHCPPAAGNCRAAEGTILYVERVDPDGDGDAHFVLLSADSITGPGLSVIDVPKSLRPHPLPVDGDRVSAAGPVYRGSYGQRQIQATEVFTAPG